MDVSSIALQGLAQADAQVEAAAASLANAGPATPDGANLDTVDIATQILALMSAETLSSVNLSVLKTVDQIQQSAVNLIA